MEKDNIVEFVKHGTRIFPIGRLDKDSQGLIFLTNNGDLVNKILRANNNHEKEYVVTVDKPITNLCVQYHASAGAQPPNSPYVRILWLRSDATGTYAHHERLAERAGAGGLA